MEDKCIKILPDGTKLSGYVTDQENQPPRECGHCIHYSEDKCWHPVIENDPEVLGEQGKPKPVGDKDCCNYFKSAKRVLLYAVRHGEDADDELIGGWENAPIDAAGEQDAKEAAGFLKGKGIKGVYSSDMKRTMETARIIAKELDIPHIVSDFRLRTWDKGRYSGEQKTEENKADLKWYKENPHVTVPEGESHDLFEDRMDEAFDFYLDEARKEGIKLIVMHNSGLKQLDRYCHNEPITSEAPDSVLPGGIAKVSEDRDKLAYEILLKEKPNSGHK